MSGKRFEWRVGWECSINADFAGTDDWEPWIGPGGTVEEVQEAVERGPGGVSDAFERVINATGFSYWVEVREAAADE